MSFWNVFITFQFLPYSLIRLWYFCFFCTLNCFSESSESVFRREKALPSAVFVGHKTMSTCFPRWPGCLPTYTFPRISLSARSSITPNQLKSDFSMWDLILFFFFYGASFLKSIPTVQFWELRLLPWAPHTP